MLNILRARHIHAGAASKRRQFVQKIIIPFRTNTQTTDSYSPGSCIFSKANTVTFVTIRAAVGEQNNVVHLGTAYIMENFIVALFKAREYFGSAGWL